MQTEIYIWSHIGHTPITHRGGAYCDLLIHSDIDCADPMEAANFMQDLLQTVPHAYKGSFYMPEYWNQNTRNRFLTREIKMMA